MVDSGLSDWLVNLTGMLEGFQFLRPWWLCLLPVIVLWVWLMASHSSYAGWAGVIDKKKLQVLKITTSGSGLYYLFAAVLVLAILALAGPSVTSLPGKTGHLNQARVFVLDLSPSMLARDIKPDRLSVAKLKLIDMLRLQTDSQSGLVVYASEAHIVVPLIDDPRITESLVPVLHPDIMPAHGSNAEQGIEVAAKLISDAGFTRGDIVLITDGLHADAITAIKSGWDKSWRLSILAIGTEQGALIPDGSSKPGSATVSYLMDAENRPVRARLDATPLLQLVEEFGGRFTQLSADSTDVNFLNDVSEFRHQGDIKQGNAAFDQFHDAGYWLALLLVPIVLIGFRKNVFWVVLPLCFISPDSEAFEWADLWLTKDQQAQRAFSRGDVEIASLLFTDPRWKAVSRYRLGQYAEVVSLLGAPEYADDLFNRGNAQALAGDLEGALVSYQIALQLYAIDKDKDNTVLNIRLVRHLLAREEEDLSNANGSGGASDALQNGVASESQSEEEAGNEQAPVGGIAGGLDTLQQQALIEQSGSEATDRDVESGLPTDANAAPVNSTELKLQDIDSNESTDSDVPATAEENDNLVLSPYSEQWLREIPDDPGGYLRRKFGFQSQTRHVDEKKKSSVIDQVRY